DSVMAVLTALAADTQPAMGELRADVPASLEALLGRLLEKDAEKRPASALAVAAALEKIGAALSALGDTGVQRATAVGLPAMTPRAPAATIAAPPTESRVPRKRWKTVGAALVAFASLALLALHLFGDKDTAPGGAPPVGAVYAGAAPNPQTLPAVRWCVGFLNKRRWLLVGSDCLFPRAANAIVNDEATTLGCQVVGAEYLLQGTTDVAGVIEKIRAAQPDLIINTLNGDTNVPF